MAGKPKNALSWMFAIAEIAFAVFAIYSTISDISKKSDDRSTIPMASTSKYAYGTDAQRMREG